MVGLVKLVGIVMVVLGAVYLVKPALLKKNINFWMKENRIYFGVILALLIAVIFLVSASRCAVSWFVVILGIVSLIKAISIFALGPKKISSLLDKIEKKPAKILRTLCGIKLVLGIILIYAA